MAAPTSKGTELTEALNSGELSGAGGFKQRTVSALTLRSHTYGAGEQRLTVMGSRIIGTLDMDPEQAKIANAHLNHSMFTGYISKFMGLVFWIFYLLAAMIVQRNNAEQFDKAVGLLAFTALIMLTSFLSSGPSEGIVKIINLVGLGAIALCAVSFAGNFGSPSLLAGLVFLELCIYVASPLDPPLRIRRMVMFLLMACAGLVHASQIYAACNTNEISCSSKIQATCGSFILIIGLVFFSTNRAGIPLDVVGFGFCVQYFMGMFVLTTETGQGVFRFLGDGATAVLSFSNVGAEFLFAPFWSPFSFAFGVLPTTIYFSALTSALTYMGVLQVFVRAVAGSLKKIIGTNLIQSVNASANLFLGMTEAPLLIRPFLAKASPSDIHCVMCGGFASIAGAVLVAYISMGISAPQLLGASVMSVPGTLVVANLACPPGSYPEEEAEKEEGEDCKEDNFEFPAPTESNVIEAAGNGTQTAIFLVLNIGAMLIAFLSLLALINAMLGQIGFLVGISAPDSSEPPLSFELICSYVFAPVAFFLGTPWDECRLVAQVLGAKVFVNEFVAYQQLEELKDSIRPESTLVATYACCGFANVGAIGIMLGALGVLCPERTKLFAKVVIRAMLAGNMVSWLNASYAAVLVTV